MNRIIIILLLLPCIAIAQKKKQVGYLMLNLGGAKIEKANPVMTGGLGFGGKLSKAFALGVGVELMKFQDDKNMYVPVYLQVSAFEHTGKLAPYITGKVGYGNYENELQAGGRILSRTSGGLYLSPGAGLYLPAGKHGIILSVSYISSRFKNKTTISGSTTTKATTTNGFGFGLTVKL